jgi:hypothetical protein
MTLYGITPFAQKLGYSVPQTRRMLDKLEARGLFVPKRFNNYSRAFTDADVTLVRGVLDRLLAAATAEVRHDE